MAEYYAVLKRAVAGLGPTSVEGRRVVYDKARNALIGQLKAIDPPLPTSEISRQRLDLEEAIRKVEREAAGAAPAAASSPARAPAARPTVTSPAMRPTAVARPAARIEPEPVTVPSEPPKPLPQAAKPDPQKAAPAPPEPEEEASEVEAVEEPPVVAAARPSEGSDSPQNVFRRAIQAAEARGASGQEEADKDSGDIAESDASVEEMPSEPPPQRPSRAAPPAVETRRQRPAEMRPVLPPEPDYDDEPSLAPEYDRDWDGPPQRAYVPPAPFVDDEDRGPRIGRSPPRGYDNDDDERTSMERRARPSRLPAILLTILILAVLGGVGALAWSQRAIISDLLASFQSSKEAATPPAQVTTSEAPPAAPGKDTDRLLSAAPANKNVRVVGEAPPATTDWVPRRRPPHLNRHGGRAGRDASARRQCRGCAGAGSRHQPGERRGDERGFAGCPKGDPLRGADRRKQFGWRHRDQCGGDLELHSLRHERSGNPRQSRRARAAYEGAPDGPPEPGFDPAGEPPHRDRYRRAGGFPRQRVRSVPRLVMKPTEEARGQPLVGASAKVADGFFWIALSSIDADVKSNLGLLKDRDWIDLPFVYETGQRAILTFEKGTPGQRVFEKALAAWGS